MLHEEIKAGKYKHILSPVDAEGFVKRIEDEYISKVAIMLILERLKDDVTGKV